jgi:hypothetical protein
MREADLVVGVRRGREVAYVLADQHVAHIVHDALHHTGATPMSEAAQLEAEERSEGQSA